MKKTKERDRESEKQVQPDKATVICPLIFKLTSLAVNYDLTWQPETKITVTEDDGTVIQEVTGVWKSSPVQRGHTAQFQRELQKLREAEELSWQEHAYYFTQEEGVEARKLYEKKVLDGELKAHITSWGPNPKKANDKSRFHKFTGVTFQELEEKYPELYKRASAPRATVVEEEVKKEEIADTTTTAETPKETIEEPSRSDLEEIQTEEKVAAATATDDIIEGIELEGSDTDDDDHTTIICYVPQDIASERIDSTNESIGWRDEDGNQRQAYLISLPEIDTEMWLEEGKWTINEMSYEVRVER